MFGYITPVLSVLTEEQKQRYRVVYCGLCHALSEEQSIPILYRDATDVEIGVLIVRAIGIRAGHRQIAEHSVDFGRVV